MTALISPMRQVIRAASSLGVLHIGSIGLTFVVGILLARQLGPSGYGVYALTMAIAAFAGMLTEFGLPILAMREFAKAESVQSWGEANGLVRWADRVMLGISVIVIGVFLFTIYISDMNQSTTFIATLFWAIFLIPLVSIAKLRGLALLSMGYIFAGQFSVLILRPTLFVVALLIFWSSTHEMSPVEAMICQVVASFFSLAVVLVLFQRNKPAAMLNSAPVNKWRKWLIVTVPMGMTEGLRLLQGQLAVVLLGWMMTSEAVGLYRIAQATASICLVSTTILNVVAAPHFSRLKAEENWDEIQKVVALVTLLMFASITALSLPFILFGKYLIVFAFGENFIGSFPALITLLIGWVFLSVFGPVSTLANMVGEEKYVTIGSVLAVIFQVILAFFTIPAFGIVGAALGVIVGQAAWLILLAFRIHRQTGLNSTIFSISVLSFGSARNFLSTMRS